MQTCTQIHRLRPVQAATKAAVTTSIRLQFDRATTIRRPTLRRLHVCAGCCTAA